MRHNGSTTKGRHSPGYLFIVIGDVRAYFYVTSKSQIYIHYHHEQKTFLRRAFVIKEVEVPPSSVLVRHGSFPLGGSECCGSHCVWYRM